MGKKRDNKDLDFISEYKKYAIIALVFITWLFFFFTYLQNTNNLEKAMTDFGEIGDFFGGMLNPLFALLALFALLQTIKIQTEELRTSNKALENSHEELRLTREETTKTREVFEEQKQTTKLQRFENTFFSMLDLHNEIVSSIPITDNIRRQFQKGALSSNPIVGRESFDVFANLLYSSVTNHYYHNKGLQLYKSFFNISGDYIGVYFRNIFQILKFISTSSIENKKFYANILRSQLSDKELYILLYHCSSYLGEDKFLPLVLEFEFFEHLSIRKKVSKDVYEIYLTKGQELFDNSYKAFGKNGNWQPLSATKIV